MGVKVEITLLCIINLLWIQPILCGNWTCMCSITHQDNLNFAPVNCSSSCDCSPVGGSSENRWTCICPADGLPKVAGKDINSSCFTACDCNSGTQTYLQHPRKLIASKGVLVVLLLCVILISLAFITSVLWYITRRGKIPVWWASFVSDRTASCSSANHLISHGTSSVPASKQCLNPSLKPFKGCIPGISFLLRSRTGAVHGTIMQFSYSELENATNKFSDTNLIGVGGSSHVYRGNLRDGRTVAVKRMKTSGGLDEEHVFLTEIELIARLHHCHVVPLLGFCLEHQGKHAERLLVFEYIPNGNLRECLDGEVGQCLEWNTRVAIALGAARGLEYLHEAAAPRILHRDVKSTNILLDENWRAKITDLGMAKHLHNDGFLSCSSSPARMQGTFGYFAPEYAIVGRASLKSDVFSFGVVLLELITGRSPIHKSPNKGEESLVIWATPRLNDSKRVIAELPDPRLEGNFQEEEMQIMAYLAKECLLLDPDSRPTMSEVVQILSTIAAEKSRRTNLPMHAFQYSSNCSLQVGNPDACGDETSSTEEIKEIMFEMCGRCSSPANQGDGFYATKNEQDSDYPSNDVETLMLLTSKSRSWRSHDDVAVDLTEPRFETFCLPNVDSHIVKIP